MKVPFIDLRSQHKDILPAYFQRLKYIFNNNDFILGKDVESFESDFARYCESRFAVGVNSGTDALFLGLLGLGIGKGDKVIVPVFTFIASALAVTYTGAQPVFVDVDPLTYNIDIGKLRRLLDKRVKAVMPVHLFGQPADMPGLFKLKEKFGFKIVEDCAQAHGAEWQDENKRWRKVGSHSDAGAFSFYPTKNLGGIGDGGIIVTQDADTCKRLKRLRDCGRVDRYRHSEIGYNSRLDTVQAAFLLLKLRKLNRYNKMRRAAAYEYNKRLKIIPGLELPFVADFARSVFNSYTIKLQDRDRVLSFLKERGVATSIYYPLALHLQEAYKRLGYKKGQFPAAERLSGQVLSLPIFPTITKLQIEYVAESIKKALRKNEN